MTAGRKAGQGTERRQRKAKTDIRWSQEEHALLIDRAQAAGMSVAAYVRHQALGSSGPRSVRRLTLDDVLIRELIGQLGYVGNNLNQLTRLGNMGDLEGADLRELDAVREKVNDTLDACLSAIGRAP